MRQSCTVQPVIRVKQLTTHHVRRMIRSQAKVSDLHMILRVKEDVDRLQVPVNHALKEKRMDAEISSIIAPFLCQHEKVRLIEFLLL